jgi:hypothetical protein
MVSIRRSTARIRHLPWRGLRCKAVSVRARSTNLSRLDGPNEKRPEVDWGEYELKNIHELRCPFPAPFFARFSMASNSRARRPIGNSSSFVESAPASGVAAMFLNSATLRRVLKLRATDPTQPMISSRSAPVSGTGGSRISDQRPPRRQAAVRHASADRASSDSPWHARRPRLGNGVFVFPSIRSRDRPISDNTVNGALRRLGF